MRILITTFGTRGDIQPFIALAKGLKAAGHEVAVCTSEGYKPLVVEHDLPYAFMDNELLRLAQAALGEIEGFADAVRASRKMRPAIRRLMDDEWNAAQMFAPDLIIYHPKCLGSYHVAEKLGIPAVMSLPLPFSTPTTAFPIPFLPKTPLGGWFNRLTYRLNRLASVMYSGEVNDFRIKTLGEPPLGRFSDVLVRSNGTPVPILYPYSPHVLPVPADFPKHVHVTGYWFLDHRPGWRPDPDLERFLAGGPPPVYVGFGSMGGPRAEQRARAVVEALRMSRQRGVLASGWGGLKAASLPDTVYMVDAVPHDWLFPQVAAVVHHGGAGTTAAGLRAGKPTVICPFLADQPFWGRVVFERGVGPAPLPQKRLTAARLSEAIDVAVHDAAMQKRAADLGSAIRSEDGIARAVEILARIPFRDSVSRTETRLRGAS